MRKRRVSDNGVRERERNTKIIVTRKERKIERMRDKDKRDKEREKKFKDNILQTQR